MGKSDQLKNSMKGGLNGLITSTASATREEKTTSNASEVEKAVHCNFVIKKSIHTRMKYLAIDKNMSLKDIVNAAMEEYLNKYEIKR